MGTCRLLILMVMLGMRALPAAADWVGNSPNRHDRQDQVLCKVGAPTWKRSWVTTRIVRSEHCIQDIQRHTHEEWYYHYGPRRLIRAVRFVNAHVVDTRTHGYGYTDAQLAGHAINPSQSLRTGLTRYEVLRLWGPPCRLLESQDTRWRHRGHGVSVGTEVCIETWTYNRGPRRFMPVLIFENGLLVDMQRAGYGH